jgi:hypothetical protein
MSDKPIPLNYSDYSLPYSAASGSSDRTRLVGQAPSPRRRRTKGGPAHRAQCHPRLVDGELWPDGGRIRSGCSGIAPGIANVLLGWDRPTTWRTPMSIYTDLIRFDGVWNITNKTATHISRAASA